MNFEEREREKILGWVCEREFGGEIQSKNSVKGLGVAHLLGWGGEVEQGYMLARG